MRDRFYAANPRQWDYLVPANISYWIGEDHKCGS